MATSHYIPQTHLTYSEVNEDTKFNVEVSVYVKAQEKLVLTAGDPKLIAGAFRLRYTVAEDTSQTSAYHFEHEPNFIYNGEANVEVITTVTKDPDVYREKIDSTNRAEPT
jgi:hypothetical protein